MANTTSPPAIAGLAAIAPAYRALLCDVWGVVHNGLTAFAPACEALARFRRDHGPVVLITNAPRPASAVRRQLTEIGVEPSAYDDIVTSGDVTRQLLVAWGSARVFNVGPERDRRLYDGLQLQFVGEEEAEVISCTGLFDDDSETPEDYEDRLRRWAGRGLTMVCANPDIVVERGDKLIYCAGALARRYGELGGRTLIAGKPHEPIYQKAIERVSSLAGRKLDSSEILAIGDGLATDIAGAQGQGIDALFIAGGIHFGQWAGGEAPLATEVSALLQSQRLGARAFMQRLSW